MFGHCYKRFDKIAIIVPPGDQTLQDNAEWYWTNIFLKRNNFFNQTPKKEWKVEIYTNATKLIERATDDDKMEYCFALNLKTFDVPNHDYDIEFMFGKRFIPDTNLDGFNALYKNPDLVSWGKWFDGNAPELYPYITEFIARAEMNDVNLWN